MVNQYSRTHGDIAVDTSVLIELLQSALGRYVRIETRYEAPTEDLLAAFAADHDGRPVMTEPCYRSYGIDAEGGATPIALTTAETPLNSYEAALSALCRTALNNSWLKDRVKYPDPAADYVP